MCVTVGVVGLSLLAHLCSIFFPLAILPVVLHSLAPLCRLYIMGCVLHACVSLLWVRVDAEHYLACS